MLIAGAVAVIAWVAAISTSCNTDRCKTVVCANGSYCQLGTCICPSGWDGPSCETQSRAKLLGNYMVYEKGSAVLAAQYPITIVIDSNSPLITNVRISNFNNTFKGSVLATISDTVITIPNQELEGKTVFGKGYIFTSPDVTYFQYGNIRMRYEVVDSITNAVNDYGYDSVVDGSVSSLWNK